MLNKEVLIDKISKANASYAAGIPFISDTEYDILWQSLYTIDPTNDLLYHTSQNRTNLTGLPWHKHQIFGTQKAFNMLDMKIFLTRFGDQPLVFEPKYDGCAAVLTKTKESWLLCLSGNGQCGTNITHMMPFIDFPFPLRNFQSIEIILLTKDWSSDFGANPRNVVAGWLARKHGEPEAIMTAVPHDFGTFQEHYTYDGDLDKLSEILLKLHAKWRETYPIDGIMVKVADDNVRLVSGNNGQVNSWSIAWKPPIQMKKTIVESIEWNVSRLGRVIPTVVYSPIDLCSTINTRVTGNNAKWLYEKQICIGATLLVGKAGEIIPKIITVNNENNPIGEVTPEDIDLPEDCPICHEPLSFQGVHLICTGDKCIAKLTVSIAYFYSHKGVKIDGIGEGSIIKLLEDPHCFAILSIKPWALLAMTTYDLLPKVISILGNKITANILREIKQSNETKTMAHFISGLGLPSLAYKSSLRLCQYVKSGELKGHITAQARENFAKAAVLFMEAKEEMLTEFTFAQLPNTAKAIYCITGTLNSSREAIIEYLSLQGYEYSSHITRLTNYLILGESPGKTKINKAIKHNIPQITEEQFMNLLTKEKKDET